MLRVVYRSYGGENKKNRPAFYSKLLALASLVRAAECLGDEVRMTFVNDGPIPAERIALMQSVGEVLTYDRLGMRGSYSTALALARKRGWPEEDLVWFAEDDYLYQPHSLLSLVEGARRLPQADYFGLWASFGFLALDGRTLPHQTPVPLNWKESAPVTVDGQVWRRALSTTSTFGVRMSALRRDYFVLALGHLAGLEAFDHAVCLHYQGERPYPWHRLRRDMVFAGKGSGREKFKHFVIAPVRAAMNLWSLRRDGSGGQLWCSYPAMCAHMEIGEIPRGHDWLAAANDCARWALAHGIPVQWRPPVEGELSVAAAAAPVAAEPVAV